MDKTTIKVINKLIEHGYATEKAILNFNIEDLCVIECFSQAEITALAGLRAAVKSNKVITYLSGDEKA